MSDGKYSESVGWQSRGYLPHFDVGEIPQVITFRLYDSLPQAVLERWREELAREKGPGDDDALRRRAREWAYHNKIVGMRDSVAAQFGRDSDEVQAVGRKRESERKTPGRRPSPTPTA
jgi:hypothetical protein